MTDEDHTSDPSMQAAEPRPRLRIIRGNPTPEDLAVITAVLAAAGRDGPSAQAAEPRPRSWAMHWRQARPPMGPGPGAWRASTRPR